MFLEQINGTFCILSSHSHSHTPPRKISGGLMALREKTQKEILSYSHQATDLPGQAGGWNSTPCAFLCSEAWV